MIKTASIARKTRIVIKPANKNGKFVETAWAVDGGGTKVGLNCRGSKLFSSKVSSETGVKRR